MLNISYLDFWPGFDSNSNWFNLLLKDIFNYTDINFNSDPNKADIILASSFGNSRFNYVNSSAKKIFYTGENERAEFSFADYALSFDYDTHGGKNFRLPHWYLYINWWDEPDFPHATISLEQLFKQWDPEEVYSRQHFCSIMIGNPVQNRIDTAVALNNYQPVHGFGKVFNNPFNGDKVKLLENFRWNICFENSITEGYVTEKLLQAKVAGCIPIYYGDITAVNDFNERCYIDLNNFFSIQDLVEYVKDVDQDKNKFLDLASRSLFNPKMNQIPSIEPLKQFLNEVLNG